MQDIILIASEMSEPAIRNYLAEDDFKKMLPKIELVIVRDGSSTGDALEKAKHLITVCTTMLMYYLAVILTTTTTTIT
jgi:hypothetical protein